MEEMTCFALESVQESSAAVGEPRCVWLRVLVVHDLKESHQDPDTRTGRRHHKLFPQTAEEENIEAGDRVAGTGWRGRVGVGGAEDSSR